jgi:hypothetical protein
MDALENYLDNINGSIINKKLNYKDFNFEDEDEFNLILNYLINNCYDIKIKSFRNDRIDQDKFRQKLLNKYEKCVVTNNNCNPQLEAAHIIPFNNESNFDIHNGLLLTRNLHITFDQNYWSIDENGIIFIMKENSGDIEKYNGKKIDLPKKTLEYLKQRNQSL